MRQRGIQSRRARLEGYDLSSGSGRMGNGRFWPALAIVAIVVATAGWTAFAVLWLGGNTNQVGAVALASPSNSGSDLPSDSGSDVPSDSPEASSHDDPALEGVLPSTWNGTPLSLQSWTGDTVLADDPWSQNFTTLLTKTGKQPADLKVAQAYDSTGATDLQVGVFKIDGVSATDLRKTMVSAWLANYPDLKTSTLSLGKKPVTKGASDQAQTTSYWYEHAGVVYDVETSDETLATAVLATLP